MLNRLHAHRAWANRRLLDWYRALPQPDDYCLRMLSHVIVGEATWLARTQGSAPARGVWDVLPAEELEVLRLKNEAAWESILASGTDRILRYRRFNGEECESSVADILTHVCTHGMYHRGQVAAQAARAGLPKVPSTDFIEFARE